MRRARLILASFLGLALLGGLFWRIPPGEVWNTLRKTHPWPLLGLVLLDLLVLVAKSERWRALVSPLHLLKPWETFQLTVAGFLGNILLPLRAGDLGRGLWLARRGLSKISGVGTVAAEKFLDALGLLSLSLPAALLSPLLRKEKGLLLGLNLLLFGLILLFPCLEKHLSTRFLSGLKGLSIFRIFWKAYLLSLFSWILQVGMILLASRALGLSLSPEAALAALVVLNLLLILPTPPANLGITQAAITATLVFYGLSPPQALSVSLLYHALQILVLLLLGPGCLAFNLLPVRRRNAGLRAEGPPLEEGGSSGAGG
ncbi:flippase-like domain-containing protein [Thermosulfurimonas marina]|uniref:Flippase-like domain-containing protein n=1 Tax=Thermosulfurimonas marina TaxID=2047767 RepID=A0A6H1WTR3_9BACT|nr:lysylphosphatidylglycerol synthase transmembrane domain-containing protein [Thermosulfurimonas marina]QJA06597.1 flippase-like domain-containing protein [Thermosulfurimonas marina]